MDFDVDSLLVDDDANARPEDKMDFNFDSPVKPAATAVTTSIQESAPMSAISLTNSSPQEVPKAPGPAAKRYSVPTGTSVQISTVADAMNEDNSADGDGESDRESDGERNGRPRRRKRTAGGTNASVCDNI
jgi:hypothetical protein